MVVSLPCSIPTLTTIHAPRLDRRITSPAPAPLHSIQQPADPVFQEIRQVPKRITMRKQVPTTCTIAVIVQP